MDTLSAGVKGELSYQSYLYSASCGKFLNTLLYLTLKKAKSLEAFRLVFASLRSDGDASADCVAQMEYPRRVE